MTIRSHHKYGPSKLGAWEICPRYDRKETKSDNNAAGEGSQLHTAVETGDDSELDNEEQAQVAMLGRAYFDMLLVRAGEGAVAYREERIEVEGLTYGYFDYAVVNKDETEADVADFKAVRKDTDHELQLVTYVVGLFEKYATLRLVRAHVVAPRKKDAYETITYTRSQLPELYARIRKVIANRENPFSPACRDDAELCETCQNIGTCPAVREVALATIPFNKPATLDATTVTDPNEAGKLRELLGMLEAWASDGISTLNQRSREGLEITGYNKVTRQGSQRITSMQDAIDILSCMGYTPDDFLKVVKFKLSDIVLLGKHNKPRLEDMLAPVLQRSQAITFLQKSRKKAKPPIDIV